MKEAHLARLMQLYPSTSDLRKRARRRIPHVAWEYLDSGTGDERAVRRNAERMAEVTLVPRFMMGELKPEISTNLFGQAYQAPFGIAPVGLGGLMWPRMECILARTADKYSIPFCLSTVGTETPETVGPIVGDMGWFQLSPPREREIRDDLLKRVEDSGFRTLVITADVPATGRRERTTRAGLRMPPRITARFVYEALKHPTWTVQTLQHGLPRLKTIEKYAVSKRTRDVVATVDQKLGGTMSWDYLKEVRDRWNGPLILKGILHPEDAERAVQTGVDGIQVSNHGGRQLDAAPAAIDALPAIVSRVQGKVSILFDGGVRSGLDIARAFALGADFVALGRVFICAVAALGKCGGDHAVEILQAELKNSMIQLGCSNLQELQTLSSSSATQLQVFPTQ